MALGSIKQSHLFCAAKFTLLLTTLTLLTTVL